MNGKSIALITDPCAWAGVKVTLYISKSISRSQVAITGWLCTRAYRCGIKLTIAGRVTISTNDAPNMGAAY